MKLTGNCKEEFGIWHFERNTPIEEYKSFHLLSETCQNALIIECLDSVGIYISIYRDFFFNDWYFKILGHCEKSHFKSRTEATIAAIEKANTIYNET